MREMGENEKSNMLKVLNGSSGNGKRYSHHYIGKLLKKGRDNDSSKSKALEKAKKSILKSSR